MIWFLLSIFILGNIALALAVYQNNPKSWTNRLFTALISVLTVYLTLNTSLFLFPDASIQAFLARFIIALGAIINLLVFVFLVTFPNNKFSLNLKITWLLTLVTFLLFVAGFTKLVFADVAFENNSVIPTPGILMPAFLVHTVGLIFGGLVILFRRYRRQTGLDRLRIRFVLISFMLLFSLVVIFNFILTVFFKIGIFVRLLPIYILIFNAIIAYSITRHRLLEIRRIVGRTVAFSLVSTFVVIFFALGLFTIPRYLPDDYSSLASVVLALLLALIFAPLQRTLARYTQVIFHRHAYNSDDLLEKLSEATRSTLSINQMTKAVMHHLHVSLRPTRAAFILIQENELSIKNFDYEPLPNLDEKQVRYLAQKAGNSTLVYEEIENKKVKKLLQDSQISVVIPLKASNTIHGIIILAEKSSGEIYSNQDLHVLEIFGPQISVAIQNSLAYDEIKRFSITLEQKVKEATADLRKANKELRHLDKLKDEFVYIATHELKTPVTVMKGYLSMIENGSFGNITDDLKDPLHEIQMANQQLILLVNDLLDIARSEAKQLKVKTEPIDMQQGISVLVKNVSTLADQKGLKIVYSHKGPLMVMGDEDRFKEIMNNLLSNAIKYSESGTIEVSHTIEKDQIITHVKDQGHGMSPTDQKHVFSRFFRSEELAHKAPGTGLGLFIVKQLVEKMGGRIWFTSALGKGTTFSFSLKRAE